MADTTFITVFDSQRGIERVLFSLADYSAKHAGCIDGWRWPDAGTAATDRFPRGRGVLLWQAKLISVPPVRLFDWVAIKATEGRILYEATTTSGRTLELQRSGTPVWGWGYVYGGSEEYAKIEAQVAAAAILRNGFAGWLIDAEQQYKVPEAKRWATAYMAELRRLLPELPVGLCSYRYPRLHPEFPWKEFVSGCDFHAPQLYWLLTTSDGAPGQQLEKSVSQLENEKKMPVVPIGIACYDPTTEWQPSLAQMRNFVLSAHRMGLPGYGWWEWAQAASNPLLWNEIVSLQ